jgi:hypothetical protein
MGFSRRSFVGLSAAAMSIPTHGLFGASAQAAMQDSIPSLELYLVTMEGTLATATVEEARIQHNRTIGESTNVARLKNLGEISHMVYLPVTSASGNAGHLLFMDIWTNAGGFDWQLFDPQFVSVLTQIFATRDFITWERAVGFDGYSIPAPQGMNHRVIALTRGTVVSRTEAMEKHNLAVAVGFVPARAAGVLSHEAYFRLPDTDESETTDFLAVDVWMNVEGPLGYYADARFQVATQVPFTEGPTLTMWTYPADEWVEW